VKNVKKSSRVKKLLIGQVRALREERALVALERIAEALEEMRLKVLTSEGTNPVKWWEQMAVLGGASSSQARPEGVGVIPASAKTTIVVPEAFGEARAGGCGGDSPGRKRDDAGGNQGAIDAQGLLPEALEGGGERVLCLLMGHPFAPPWTYSPTSGETHRQPRPGRSATT
jgi:hypothetical protein